jgi:hypothetical protein
LFQAFELRRETSVHAQNLFIDEGSHREAVKTLGKYFPETNIEPTFALVVETINSINRRTFVVSPQQEKVLRVLNFISQKKADGLQTLLPAINIIPQEQIVGLGWKSTILKKPQKI